MIPVPTLFRKHALIKDVPIFSTLSWLDIQRIAARAKFCQYKKGEIIYSRGDPADGFYCLISGRVQAYVPDESGAKKDVEFFRRGMYFGIISSLTGKTHSMTFETLNDSLILRIPYEEFHFILKAIPQISLTFSKSLSQRLHARSSQRMEGASSIISLYGAARGAGSSTYAFHLAVSLRAQTGKEVILVTVASHAENPAEPEGPQVDSAPKWIADGVGIAAILENPELMKSSIIKSTLGIGLLRVALNPDDASLLPQISHFVTTLVLDYEFVVLDLPNQMDTLVLKTLTQSDYVHLISRDREEELRLIRKVIDELEEALKEKFDPQKVRVLISGEPSSRSMSTSQIKDILDYDIYQRLSHIAESELSQPGEFDQALKVKFPSRASFFLKEVTRISREVGGVRVGLVLGGGAALGVAHIGVLKVFERERIPVDILAGSSMGALVASLWACGYDADRLEEIAGEFNNQKSMIKLFDPVVPISGVIGGRLIKRWLHRYLGEKCFDETWLPLKIVAYDLMSRQELVYDSGELLEAVRRSISIPGIFEPVIEDDRVIIDGGVLNPVPTNVLKKEGVEKIIAVNVLQSPEEVVRGLEMRRQVLSQEKQPVFYKAPLNFLKYRLARGAVSAMFKPIISDIMVRTLLASEYELAERTLRHADVVIHPDLADINWYELYRVDELIQRGERAAEEALPRIHALIQQGSTTLF